LNLKADFDILKKFEDNVESKILSELKLKIDKIELKRSHNAIRRKLDRLEGRVQATARTGSSGPGVPTVTNNNKKCISCDREISEQMQQLAKKAAFERQHLAGGEIGGANRYLFRELAKKGPKFGIGFSRALNAMSEEKVGMMSSHRQSRGGVGV